MNPSKELAPTVPLDEFIEDFLIKEEDERLGLSKAQFLKCLPKGSRGLLTEKLIEEVNNLIENTPLRESFRDNLLAYTHVLAEGKFKLKDYIRAIHYVSCKLMGDSNIDAYVKTFPDRYQSFIDNNYPVKDIHSVVTGYNKNLMVTKIMEQALVPTWLLNQDLYQKALNTAADLMLNARSEKVRIDAAATLLVQLKMPEAAKVHLDISVKEDDSITELRRSTLELVKQQRLMLESGAMSAKEVAEQRITKVIEGEVIENV